MKLTRRHKLLAGFAVLFLIINIILIYADKDQKIAQTSHVLTWTEVTEQDMYESLDKEGVLDYSTENNLYFDEKLGEFESFLVEEGQEVTAGDELYSYQVQNYYETALALEGEIDKVTNEITAIEAAIAKMGSYQIATSQPSQPMPQPPVDQSSSDETDDNAQLNQIIDIMSDEQSNDEAELLKEQYITEKEKELDQKIAEVDSLDAQLNELTTTGESITIESPQDGVVTHLSDSLSDPLLTIQSDDLIVRSELTETEHLKVEPDLSVEITMKESGEMEEGVIQTVDKLPENISLHGESDYPFIVSFSDKEEQAEDADIDVDDEFDEEDLAEFEINEDEEESESEESNDETDLSAEEADEEDERDLAPGYHVDLEIITDESLEASVVNQRVLHGLSVWKMTQEGTLVKIPVETGLKMEQMIEIEEGVNKGDLIARQPEERFSSNTPFITSLDVKKVNGKRLKSDRWFQDIMIGLISR